MPQSPSISICGAWGGGNHIYYYFSKFEIANYAKEYFKLVGSYEHLKLTNISNSNWTGVVVLKKK